MSETVTVSPGSPRHSWRAALIALGTILVLWGLSAWLVVAFLPTWSERGTFGDMFGAVNALFSGLALAGVVFAILLQRTELELQRFELSLTRNELQRTARSQEKSERIRELQYLMELTPRFTQFRRDYHAAWLFLREHSPDEEFVAGSPKWKNLVSALTACYKSTRFLYQIAVLTNQGILDAEALYLLYYDDITNHPQSRIGSLADYCGTGHELAANYDWYDVIRMSQEIQKLLELLAPIHRRRGGDTFDFQAQGLAETRKELEERGDPYGGIGA